MHVILLGLGLVISLAGIALIGFGLPINAAALGNTLIIAGTIAIVGSLVLIGLASAIRQLRRIAQALEARPLPRTPGSEPAEPAPRLHTSVLTPSPSSEPRLEAEPRLDAEPERPTPAVEPTIEPMVPPASISPVLPVSPVAPVVPEDHPSAAEAAPEVAESAIPPPASTEEPVSPRLSPPPEPPPPNKFDAIWSGEPPPEAPRQAAVEVAVSAAVIEPARTDDVVPVAPAGAPEGVTIFKSGVIDGMAYTLYTDGSIEAELAQQTVKFASIDELRAYLAARE